MTCSYPTYDFCIWRGEDKEFIFSFSYKDGEGSKIPLVLDEYTFSMTVGLAYPKKVFDKLTTQNGRLTTGALKDGVFTPSKEGSNVLCAMFTHEATRKIPEGDAAYSLIKIDKEGKREIMLTGKVTVHGGIEYE